MIQKPRTRITATPPGGGDARRRLAPWAHAVRGGLVAVGLGLLAATAAAQARITVLDGDTLRLDGETIRLWGIDAPEGGQRCTRAGVDYDCGAAATAALSRFVASGPVRCATVERDRFGRTVARCQVGGDDLGALMVRSGWALDYVRYSGGAYAAPQAAAERAADGLWRGEFTAPWTWRRQQ